MLATLDHESKPTQRKVEKTRASTLISPQNHPEEDKRTLDEAIARSSGKSTEKDTPTAKLRDKEQACESPKMSEFKNLFKEMVAVYMSRIGSVLVVWLIATLVLALLLTVFTSPT